MPIQFSKSSRFPQIVGFVQPTVQNLKKKNLLIHIRKKKEQMTTESLTFVLEKKNETISF